ISMTQNWEVQSLGIKQCLFSSQGGHDGPPQSTSVSVLSTLPLLQVSAPPPPPLEPLLEEAPPVPALPWSELLSTQTLLAVSQTWPSTQAPDGEHALRARISLSGAPSQPPRWSASASKRPTSSKPMADRPGGARRDRADGGRGISQ